jgi:molecular chaperone DnaJ
MAKRDYYEILGVSSNASEGELKSAYRKRARELHPDRNRNKSEAERKALEVEFQEVGTAYETLSNPEKRALYDQLGHAGYERFQAGGGAGTGGFGGAHDFSDVFGDFGNIFSEMFGGRRGSGRARRTQPGSDLKYKLSIDLKDVIFGCEAAIKIPRLGRCQVCSGTGSKDGSKPAMCGTCRGVGQVYLQHGPFSIQQTCPDCQGQGERITSPCSSCQGSGQVREMRTLKVKIPVGVDEGDQIRLSGEGEAGSRGGEAGDLYVEIHINPDPLFKRKEYDLYGEIPVNYVTAVLGGDVEIPTIDGKVRMHIPQGTPNGKVLKLKGKGIPKMRGRGAGDLFLTLMVEVPSQLTQEQINLLKEFESSLTNPERHYPRIKNWTQDIKSFFTPKSN